MHLRSAMMTGTAICLVALFFCMAPLRANAEQPLTIWCNQLLSHDLTGDQPQMVAYAKAEENLCYGKFAPARDGFAAIVPYWVKWQNNGRWWLDTARGYFYSLIATGDDAKARNFLTSVETGNSWKASDGDRRFWDGDPKAAFTAYAAAAGTISGMSGDPREQNIDDAAQASGDMNAAIAILQRTSHAYGPGDVGSLQLLMLGDAYETQQRWSDAFAAWVRAADSGHQVMEYDNFDRWNLSALEMIYYYRAHIPSDQRSAPSAG